MKRLFYSLISVMVTFSLAGLLVHAQPKRELMRDAHALVFDHSSLKRTIEKLDNGVRTITTTTNAEMVPVLRRHPRDMAKLYGQGGMVRAWDPLFRELAAVSDKVTMDVRDIEHGVEVICTSEDPEVVKLIQAHAEKVSDMAERGSPAMRESTPIPAGYNRPGQSGTPADSVSTSARQQWDREIIQIGVMREVLGGQKHEARALLKEVLARPNFYGVGALASLAGEVTILDGVPTATRVDVEGHPLASKGGLKEQGVTLLFGAYVPEWTEHLVGHAISPDRLDETLAEMAAGAGLDMSKPFVFAIDGEFTEVRLHVINGACPVHARRNGNELSPEKRPYEASLASVHGTIVGLFATNAEGTMTHPGTTTHLHLIYTDDATGAKLNGHVEQAGMSSGSVLYLPLID